MPRLREIRATFECDRCGKQFSAIIDPSYKINTNYFPTTYELALDAVRGGLDYRGPEGICCISDGDAMCGVCADLDLETIHPERPQSEWTAKDFYSGGQVPQVGDLVECVRPKPECGLDTDDRETVEQVCSGFVYINSDAWRASRFMLISRCPWKTSEQKGESECENSQATK